MDIKTKREILEITDERTICIYHIVDMPFLSYVHIDTTCLCYSLGLSNIYFKLFNDGKIEGENCITSDMDMMSLMSKQQIIDTLLEAFEQVEIYYNEGLRDNDPGHAFCLLDKKDLVSQYYKSFVNQDFKPYEMYVYGKDCYSRCEDNYGYEILFPILKGYRLSLDRVDEELREELKLEMNKNGYITIYRGFNKYSQENGTSYSLSKKVAQFFANRWESDGYVKEYKVHISDVVAYMEYEKEILTERAVEIND